MSQLVQLEGKHTVQTAHCALPPDVYNLGNIFQFSNCIIQDPICLSQKWMKIIFGMISSILTWIQGYGGWRSVEDKYKRISNILMKRM